MSYPSTTSEVLSSTASNSSVSTPVVHFVIERSLRFAESLFIYDGHYQAALSCIEDALSVDPKHRRALVLKADILFCLGFDESALKILNRVIDDTPGALDAYISKIAVLEGMSQPIAALRAYQEARTILESKLPEKNDWLFWSTLTEQALSLWLQLGRYRKAYETLQNVQSKLPKAEFDQLQQTFKSYIQHGLKQRKQLISQQARFKGSSQSRFAKPL